MALSGVLAGHTRTPYLDGLLERAGALAERLAEVDHGAPEAEQRRRDALLATLRLDGSPIAGWPDDDLQAAAGLIVTLEPDAAGRPGTTADVRGTWFDAFRSFDEVPDEALLARELLGARAAHDADDLADLLVTAPGATLAELHRRLTHGLVAPERAAQLRASEQAVHDASIGRILYFTVDLEALPAAFAALTDWLGGPASDLPPLLAAGVLHLEILRLHPFDAANGRLARAAARLWLRRGGLDPGGLAVPELSLATDALGYHEEVARTLRRRDTTIWLERWAEAVVDGLQGSARALGLTTAATAATADAALAALGPQFTLAEARDHLGHHDLAQTRTVLEAAVAGGALQRVPGTHGLRFRQPPPD